MRSLALALMFVAASASGQNRTVAPPVGPQPAAQTSLYSYNSEGRRDPFVSLLRRGGDAVRRPGAKAAEGSAAFLVSEVVLKGIMLSRGERIALIQGPDNKTYQLRVNDRLLDGSVRNITADTLVMLEDVNDPLSLAKQREVRKVLRAVVEAK
ncbi:MAG: pilus assembly protein PilP [Acidobacteriota bacterium]